jgi:hypothetical protein
MAFLPELAFSSHALLLGSIAALIFVTGHSAVPLHVTGISAETFAAAFSVAGTGTVASASAGHYLVALVVTTAPVVVSAATKRTPSMVTTGQSARTKY